MAGSTINTTITIITNDTKRGLVGKEITISDQCKGLCIHVADKDKVHVESEFTSFVLWQHGKNTILFIKTFF